MQYLQYRAVVMWWWLCNRCTCRDKLALTWLQTLLRHILKHWTGFIWCMLPVKALCCTVLLYCGCALLLLFSWQRSCTANVLPWWICLMLPPECSPHEHAEKTELRISLSDLNPKTLKMFNLQDINMHAGRDLQWLCFLSRKLSSVFKGWKAEIEVSFILCAAEMQSTSFEAPQLTLKYIYIRIFFITPASEGIVYHLHYEDWEAESLHLLCLPLFLLQFLRLKRKFDISSEVLN